MTLLLQKILGILLQPSTILALCLLFALHAGYRLRPKTARRWTLGAFAIFLVCGVSPLGDILISHLERRFPRPGLADVPVAGIIVLGGSEGIGNDRALEVISTNEAGERLVEAVILARAHPKARIVILGGGNPLAGAFAIEAEATARAMELLGIDRARMTLETTSRTTWENAVKGVPLIAAKPEERWVLVTSAWHMPRSVGVFRKQGLEVTAFPVDYQTGKTLDLWRINTVPSVGLAKFDGIVREYPALLYYWLIGRIDRLFPAPV